MSDEMRKEAIDIWGSGGPSGETSAGESDGLPPGWGRSPRCSGAS